MKGRKIMRIKHKTERIEYVNSEPVDYHYTMYFPDDPKGFKISELIEVLQHIYTDKGDEYIQATHMYVDDMLCNSINAVRVCEWANGKTIGFYTYNL